MVVSDGGGGPVAVESAAIAAGEELLFGLSFGSLGLATATATMNTTATTIHGVEATTAERDDDGDEEEEELHIQCSNKIEAHQKLQTAIAELLQLRDPSLLTSHAIFATSGTKDKALDRLFAWATRCHGAVLDRIYAGKDAYGGRGLFASTKCSDGAVLAVLPRSLRIGQKLACQRIGRGEALLLSTSTPDLTAVSLLVLSFLQDALGMGSDNDTAVDNNNHKDQCHDADNNPNNWGLYAQSLPHARSELLNAVIASESELEECLQQFDNSNDNTELEDYRRASKNVRSTADSCVQYIRQVLLAADTNDDEENDSSATCIYQSSASNNNIIPNDSAIYWAIAIVMSRTHAFGSHLGGRWLTPLLDLANHSPDPNCQLEGDSEGRLLLKAMRHIRLGDEITIDYQVDEDPKLLATYGFSLEHNTCL